MLTKNIHILHALYRSQESEGPPGVAAAKSLQSCPTLCDPRDGSLPGSPVLGILQARVLEWGAIAFSNAWKWKVKVKSLSHVRLLVTPWTAAYQAPPSMGFSRQEYWSGVPLPSPSDSSKWKKVRKLCKCWFLDIGSYNTNISVYDISLSNTCRTCALSCMFRIPQ